MRSLLSTASLSPFWTDERLSLSLKLDAIANEVKPCHAMPCRAVLPFHATGPPTADCWLSEHNTVAVSSAACRDRS